jgi:hypothetical protein
LFLSFFITTLFADCDLLLDERGYTKLRTDPGGITNYDLEYYVPIPVEGIMPKKNFSWKGLTITVKCFACDGEGKPKLDSPLNDDPDFSKFKGGDVYFAKITLRLEEGVAGSIVRREELKSVVREGSAFPGVIAEFVSGYRYRESA